jgi:hypothetical protein
MAFEYVTHATLPLHAALKVTTGRVHGQPPYTECHTSLDVLGFRFEPGPPPPRQ